MKQTSRLIRFGRISGARRTRPPGGLGLRAACATVLSATLTAGLLSSSAATAEEAVPTANRGLAVGMWLDGGTGVKEAAKQALLGSDEDIRKFLTDVPSIQRIDDRVDLGRVVNAGGLAVREAAKKAAAGTPRT